MMEFPDKLVTPKHDAEFDGEKLVSKRTSIALNISDYKKLEKAKGAFEEFEGQKLSWGKFLSSLSAVTLIGLELTNEVDR